MNGMRRWMTLMIAGLAISPVLAETGRVEVLSDRVNLRAKPRPEAEVAGQVGLGAVLEFRGTNAEWVGVAPPTNIGLWVSSEFIKDNKVGTDKLNVRAGVGISYPVVGTLYKNDTVIPRGQMGQWMEIAPPSNAVLWVHRDYVKTVIEASSAPAGVPSPAASAPKSRVPERLEVPLAPALPKRVASAPAAGPAVAPPPDMKESEMVPLPGQGETMEFEGALHKTSFFDFGRVSNYCLVKWDDGRPTTVCYIRGNNAQLKTFEGRRLRIKGDGYWIKDSAKPVLIPRQITPLLDSPEAGTP
jgi:hypothetical protein